MTIEAYPGKRPTQEIDEYWIRAQAPRWQEHKPTERCGKWMIFVRTERLDDAWAKVRVATEHDRLGIAAKTATMRPNPNAQDPDVKVICVYTYDGADRQDVGRVLAGLRQLGFGGRLYWKADATTRAGLYGGAGYRVSRWSSTDFEADG